MSRPAICIPLWRSVVALICLAGLSVAIRGQTPLQFAELDRLRGPDRGGNTLALGDVDRDGDLDLVTGNSGRSSTVHLDDLHLNDGTRTFTLATSSHMPNDGSSTPAVRAASRRATR